MPQITLTRVLDFIVTDATGDDLDHLQSAIKVRRRSLAEVTDADPGGRWGAATRRDGPAS